MKIAITGTPGTGKTSVARALAKKLKARYLNEKQFCKSRGVGKLDRKGEWSVPLKKFESALNKWLAGKENAVVEGHLLCEVKAKVGLVVVLECSEKELYKRLAEKNKYSEEKMLDNVFCEKICYCKKNAVRNYGKKKVFCANSSKRIKETTDKILRIMARVGK